LYQYVGLSALTDNGVCASPPHDRPHRAAHVATAQYAGEQRPKDRVAMGILVPPRGLEATTRSSPA